VLSVHDITAGYIDDVDILQGVSLDVPEGKIVSLIGPNGSGKSTLLRVICGFLAPTAGEVHYGGRRLNGHSAHEMAALGISYLPQERTTFPHLSVERNVHLGGWTIKRDKAHLRQAVARVFERFPMLAERRASRAGDLSGGLQKMLELARALVIEPRLLIFDEPTVGLAPAVAKDVYRTLNQLREQALTVLLVDQNIREAVALADHIYVLEVGRNKSNGTRKEFETDLHGMIKEWL
jgi:ABC-type branched-subunit amino acid transport system ATPase component